MPFVHDDGGRSAAGFKGEAGDCVARALAIVTGRPYADIYAYLAYSTGAQRKSKRGKKRSASARNGINTKRLWFQEYAKTLGLRWVPTMTIGSGCTVHLLAQELPPGRLVVAVSKHYVAVIDGIIHDTYDCSRDGTRCVYGYWVLD